MGLPKMNRSTSELSAVLERSTMAAISPFEACVTFYPGDGGVVDPLFEAFVMLLPPESATVEYGEVFIVLDVHREWRYLKHSA